MHKTRPVALYKTIENDLLEKINSGFFSLNDSIPTELELSKKYSVSRVTVRQATNNLVAKGYLERVAGSGTFVRKPALVEKGTKIESFSEEMSRRGKSPSTKLIKFTILPADEFVSSHLKVEIGSTVYYFERLRLADDIPMCFERTYMSVSAYPDLTVDHLLKSKYDYVEKIKGEIIAYTHQQLSPIFPNQEIADILKCDSKLPIIRVSHTTYLDNGNILDYTEIDVNTSIYQLNFIKSRK